MKRAQMYEFGDPGTFAIRVVLDPGEPMRGNYIGNLTLAVDGRWWGETSSQDVLNSDLAVLQSLPSQTCSEELVACVSRLPASTLIATAMQEVHSFEYAEAVPCEGQVAEELHKCVLAPFPLGNLFGQVAFIAIRMGEEWRMCACSLRLDVESGRGELEDVRQTTVSHSVVAGCIEQLFAALPSVPHWRGPVG